MSEPGSIVSVVAAQWLERISATQGKCTLFTEYKPKPGGQTEFWRIVPFNSIEDIPYRVLWLRGGVGCFSGDTLINGIPAKDQQDAPVLVKTLTGEYWASPVYKKGQADLYRVKTRSGKSVDVTVHHRFLTPTGFCQLQYLGVGSLVAGSDIENDRSYSEKATNSLGYYQEDFRCGGEQPHPVLVFAQEFAQRFFEPDTCFPCTSLYPDIESCAAGSYTHLSSSEHRDASIYVGSALYPNHRSVQAQHKLHHSGNARSPHPLVDSVCDRSLHYQHQVLDHVQQLLTEPMNETLKSVLRSAPCCCNFSSNQPQQIYQYLTSEAYNSLWLRGGNYIHSNLQTVDTSAFWDEIISIEYVGFDDFYDLHVPIANHYLANGLYHHNSGKSHVGSAFVCSRAYHDPKSRGLITANTYKQLSTSTLVALAEFCEQFNIPLHPKRETVEETAKAIANIGLCRIFDASLFVLSADSFTGVTDKAKEGGRGLQVRYFWGDEWAYADKSAFDTINGRLGRGNGRIKGLGLITSSINKNNPFNWAYEMFDDPERTEDKVRLYRSVNCLTSDNDSLDPDYVQSLTASYTEQLAAIELRGEYTNAAEGLLFSYFDRSKHVVAVELDPNLPLHISFDFNRSPATCSLANLRSNRITISEEFYLLNSDTFKLAAAAATRIRALNPLQVIVYGDASGSSRTANSQQSNWDIVRAAFKDLPSPKSYRYPASNPPIIDTVNSVNVLLRDDRLLVHPRCKELIKDLEFCRDDGRGGIEKKTDPMRTHLIDGVRYLCFTLAPFRPAPVRPIAAGEVKTVRY